MFFKGLVGINNFGVGGVNCHALVEPNYKTMTNDCLRIAESIPRIVNICGRTQDSVKHIFTFIENNPQRVTKDFLALLAQTMKYTNNINSAGFPYRGRHGMAIVCYILVNSIIVLTFRFCYYKEIEWRLQWNQIWI